MIVAIVEHTQQTGSDQWQTFHEVKVLTGSESVSDVMQWAVGITKDLHPNILLVREKEQSNEHKSY